MSTQPIPTKESSPRTKDGVTLLGRALGQGLHQYTLDPGGWFDTVDVTGMGITTEFYVGKECQEVPP